MLHNIVGDDGRVYFKAQELKCKGSGGGVLAPGFAEHLVMLRQAFGHSMAVVSCCRSRAYNAKVGGKARSFHIYDTPFWPTGGACAIDIATPNPELRTKLLDLAAEMGWTIGLYKTFVHLDRRVDYTGLPQIVFEG